MITKKTKLSDSQINNILNLYKKIPEWNEKIKIISNNLNRAHKSPIGRLVAIFSTIRNFFQRNGFASYATLALRDIKKFDIEVQKLNNLCKIQKTIGIKK